MSVVRTILKWVLRFFLFIILLLLLTWVALQFSAVQTWVANKVTDSLEKTLNTEVSIGKVDLDFFKTLVLEDVYVEAQNGDTLLYAGALDADIGVFNLFGSEIYLNSIELDRAYINLNRAADSTDFNYQFLVDAFATTDTTTTSAAWDFGIGDVYITDTRIVNRDEVTGADQRVRIGHFGVEINELDLVNQAVEIDKVLLENSFVRAEVFVGTEIPDTLVVDEVTGELEYPYTGWDVAVNEIDFSDNRIEYEDLKRTQSVEGLDASNLALTDFDLKLNDFAWNKEKLTLQLDNFSFTEANSGYDLNKVAFGLNATPTGIEINDLIIQTGASTVAASAEVTFDSWNDLATMGDRLAANLSFDNTEIAFSDLRLIEQFGGPIPILDLSINESIFINGGARFRPEELAAADLRINVGNDFRVRLDATVRDFDSDNPRFDITLKEAGISYRDLERFTNGLELPPQMARLGNIDLIADIEGTANDFLINNVKLDTDSYTGLSARGRVWNAMNPKLLRYDFEITELTTRYEDIAGFLPPEGVPQLDSLGRINYSGTLKGSLTEVDVIGYLQTDAGDLRADADLKFNEDYTDLTWRGDLKLEQFDLARVMADTTLGTVSLTLSGSGSGLDIASLNAESQLLIEEFTYMGYTYHDIALDGKISDQRFVGQLLLDDENVQLDFDGTVDLNAAHPEFDFVLNIDTVNLHALNLVPDSISLSARLVADFTATNVDDLNGRAVLSDFWIAQRGYEWYSDSLVVDARQLPGEAKALTVDSDYLKIAMTGQYTLSRLPDAFATLTNEFIDVEDFLFDVQETVSDSVEIITDIDPGVLDDQNFELALEICEPDPYRLFVPAIDDFNCFELDAKLDGAQRQVDVDAKLTQLKLATGMAINNIQLTMDGTRAGIVTQVAVREIELSETMEILAVDLNTELKEGALDWRLAVDTDSVEQTLALGGNITNAGEAFSMKVDQDFFLNGEEWRVPSNHEVLFGNNRLEFGNLRFQRNLQEIRVQTGEADAGETTNPVSIFFSNFKISEISRLAMMQQDFFAGRINGKLVLNDLKGNPYYLADLQADSLTLNGEPVGTLSIDASQQANSSNITLAAALSGTANQMTVDGNYDLAAQNFNVAADIQKLEMRLIDPLSAGAIRDSEGHLSGNVTVRGSPDAPDIGGSIQTNNLSTTPVVLGVAMRLSDGTISLSNSSIDLGQFTLYDERGNAGDLRGQILHDNFTNITFDISLNADNFLVMDTTPEDNPLFYGKVFADVRLDVSGGVELPILDIVATTLDSTVFTMSPLAATDDDGLSPDEYIIFQNPEEYYADENRQDYQATVAVPIKMRMVLDVNPGALFRMIMDPALGEGLSARGNANLEVNLNPNGEVLIYGNYIAQEGSYDIQFGPIGRSFTLMDGGTVDFNGDPLTARMNVSAAYDVQTPLYPLISSQSNLSEAEKQNAQQRELVRVLLFLNGEILSPEITFDITLPEQGGSGGMNSAVSQKLASMRSNPDELNRQVFGLLLQKSFIAEQSGGGFDAGAAAGSAALGLATNILNDQLRNITDNLIKGVEFSVNVDSYNNEYTGDNVTTASFAISKQLFNERISVSYGQDFNVGGASQSAGGSQVIGDFILTYRLTDSGRYLLRAFHVNEFDVLQGENTGKNGVGLRYSRSFGEQ